MDGFEIGDPVDERHGLDGVSLLDRRDERSPGGPAWINQMEDCVAGFRERDTAAEDEFVYNLR